MANAKISSEERGGEGNNRIIVYVKEAEYDYEIKLFRRWLNRHRCLFRRGGKGGETDLN